MEVFDFGTPAETEKKDEAGAGYEDGAATGRSETTQDGGFKLPEYTSDNTFNLKEALEKVEKHYIELAIKDAGHKKSKLARLLGMKNYQTVSHRLDKFDMEI